MSVEGPEGLSRLGFGEKLRRGGADGSAGAWSPSGGPASISSRAGTGHGFDEIMSAPLTEPRLAVWADCSRSTQAPAPCERG